MLGLAQIPGNGLGQQMLSLTELQSAPELMRLPQITPPQLNPDPVSGGCVPGGTHGRWPPRAPFLLGRDTGGDKQKEQGARWAGEPLPQPRRLRYAGLQRCQAPTSRLLAAFYSGIPGGKSLNQAVLRTGGG